MSNASTFEHLHWLAGQQAIIDAGVPLPTSADVVVIGGGYVGGATAYFLTTMGLQPVLVERRGISTGATGRNAGFIAPGLGMSFLDAVDRYGADGARARLAFTRRGRDLALSLIRDLGITCALETPGGLTLAASAEEWQSLRTAGEALRDAGAPVEVLDRTEIEPHLNVPVPDLFHGALFNPETALVNPAQLNAGIVRAAQQRGALVYTGTEVHALTGQRRGGISVETSRGSIDARYAVLATNAWSPLLAGFLTDRIRPVRGQMLATVPAPPIFRRAMSTNYGYEYWSQRADGVIVLGGGRWATADRDEGYFAEELQPDIQGALYRFLTSTFPTLSGIGVARRWSGIMGFSRDGYPFIGAMPYEPRLLVAAGFTGHGGPYFAIAARCIAQLITTGRSDDSITDYALDRPL